MEKILSAYKFILSAFPANICWSSRHLENVLKTCLEDVFKTSWRHALKTSSKRLQRNNFSLSKTSWKRLKDVLKTSCKNVLKTSWKTKNCYAADALKTPWRHVFKMSSRHVFKTSLRHVSKTSSRRLLGMFTGNICI